MGLVVKEEKVMGGLRSIKNILVETKYILLYGVVSIITMVWCHPLITLLISTLMFFYSYIRQKNDRPEIDLRFIIRSLISGSIPRYSTLIVVILFIVYTSWLADFLAKGYLLKAIASLFFTLGIIPLYAMSLNYNFGSQTDRVPKKILVSALSEPKGEASFEDLNNAYKNGEEALVALNKNKRHNWIPILRLHLFHKDKLQKWFILVSDKSKDFIKHLQEITGEQGKVKHYVADFNNYESISFQLLRILREIKKEGYNDEDISVYISGGTSAVTLALTLFAVKDGRQVEYIRQDNEDIVAINIGLEDLYSFNPEG